LEINSDSGADDNVHTDGGTLIGRRPLPECARLVTNRVRSSHQTGRPSSIDCFVVSFYEIRTKFLSYSRQQFHGGRERSPSSVTDYRIEIFILNDPVASKMRRRKGDAFAWLAPPPTGDHHRRRRGVFPIFRFFAAIALRCELRPSWVDLSVGGDYVKELARDLSCAAPQVRFLL